ncbi:MAG: pseudouridine synthase [Promethearchaeota archaeon]|nr:MAG: pseudouridine synthase [Candidatus Lokiarchaeota archaeon]
MNTTRLLALRKLHAISDYQFGPVITKILFNNESEIEIIRSANTNKIKYIHLKDELLLSLKPTTGLFTLSFLAAKIIINETKCPKLRAVVLSEISKFIKKGRNVFCKHITDIDTDLRPMDEVIVVNQEDEILAIGRINIPIAYIKTFNRGEAINVRKGIGS